MISEFGLVFCYFFADFLEVMLCLCRLRGGRLMPLLGRSAASVSQRRRNSLNGKPKNQCYKCDLLQPSKLLEYRVRSTEFKQLTAETAKLSPTRTNRAAVFATLLCLTTLLASVSAR